MCELIDPNQNYHVCYLIDLWEDGVPLAPKIPVSDRRGL